MTTHLFSMDLENTKRNELVLFTIPKICKEKKFLLTGNENDISISSHI